MVIESKGAFRPYAPLANIVAVLQRLRRMNTPPRLSPEFFAGAGVSESLQSRVVATLKFLQFIDEENRPTDTLRALAVAPDEEYRKLLEESVRSAYREDFENIDPAVDPQGKILNAYQRYQPRSQHERQVMLLLGLCREAGMTILDAPRERGMQDGPKKAARARGRPPGRGKVAASANATTPVSSGASGAAQPRDDVRPMGLFGLVGLVEQDAALLDEAEFAEVWQALGTVVGKVARARARSQHTPSAIPRSEDGPDEGLDDA
ncbi:MAG TPA: DUF5343 domain-containing protein [Chloroflexota bacterium]|nr:DUF5343 domain-containing protein [Chloroflexota bacterium]